MKMMFLQLVCLLAFTFFFFWWCPTCFWAFDNFEQLYFLMLKFVASFYAFMIFVRLYDFSTLLE